MANVYVPKHFRVEELVSRKTFETLGAARILRYFDSRILEMADKLAAHFCYDADGKKIGSATINNWVFGGKRQYSGLRLPGEPEFKQWSDHSFGRALDIVFSTATADEVRDHIEANPQLYPYITFIEEGARITWLHISCANPIGFGVRLKNENSLLFWDADTKSIREVLRG